MPATRNHVRKSDPARCPICNITVSRGTDLGRHQKTHLSAKERAAIGYNCKEKGCNFTCLQKSNFRTHMNTHTKEQPYGCPDDDCDSAFSDPGSLTRHRKDLHKYVPPPRRRYVVPAANDVETPEKSMDVVDSPESGLDSGTDTDTDTDTPTATSPSGSESLSLSSSSPPPVPSTPVNYGASPVLGRTQGLSIPRLLVPTRPSSEPRITLPGVEAMLAGAPHFQTDTLDAPSPIHNNDERHSRSTSAAAFVLPPLLDFKPSPYTYPPPLPPQYSRLGYSISTRPSQMEDGYERRSRL